ncbi:hypothetical protein IFM89_021048 [Coptis chinensis]|uniref:Uncharacterized protein n=1 Tax=Coptis chinensis TaxID=261450 RepID=A0A835H7T0_9MAGN|nr:hypothetical protein IFM89_021048 [Coptis chinensis]
MTNLCAPTNNSPTLPSVHIYSVPKMLSIRTLQPVLPSSSSGAHKFGLSLVSEDSLTIVAAKAVALANAAAQAAREAMILHCEENKFECENDEIMESCDMRRVSAGTWRKRRKRREEKFPCNELNSVGKILQFPLRKSRSARLTPNEEAEFTLHLKEGARLDAAKTRARETSQCAFTSSQWDASTGMKRRKLEMIMCKARESRERIISSYRRFVVLLPMAIKEKD